MLELANGSPVLTVNWRSTIAGLTRLRPAISISSTVSAGLLRRLIGLRHSAYCASSAPSLASWARTASAAARPRSAASRIAAEIGGRDRAEIGLDQDVRRFQGGQGTGHVLLGEDVDHLRRYGEQGADPVGVHQGRADVDRDHDVGVAAFARFRDRHVVHQAAIDQFAAVQHDRRQQARHRHAGAHRRGQAAFAQDDALAGADVGGDDRQRQRQFLDDAFVLAGADQAVEKQLDLDAIDDARRESDAVAGHADFGSGNEAAHDLLVAVIDIRKVRNVGKHVVPVRFGHLLAHFRRRQAGGIGAGDQRAHAGAGDAVDRYLQFLENFEYPDMCRAAGTAATEHEPDFRTAGVGDCLCAHGHCQQDSGDKAYEREHGSFPEETSEKKPRASGVFDEARRLTWCR